MPEKTLDQQRAAHAWEQVSRAKGISETKQKEEFRTEGKKLPIRIMQSGLGHALAFLQAKAGADRKPGAQYIIDAMNSWGAKRQYYREGGSLQHAIFTGDSLFQRRATAEILAYIQWLNRFIEAEGVGSKKKSDRE